MCDPLLQSLQLAGQSPKCVPEAVGPPTRSLRHTCWALPPACVTLSTTWVVNPQNRSPLPNKAEARLRSTYCQVGVRARASRRHLNSLKATVQGGLAGLSAASSDQLWQMEERLRSPPASYAHEDPYVRNIYIYMYMYIYICIYVSILKSVSPYIISGYKNEVSKQIYVHSSTCVFVYIYTYIYVHL